VLLFKAAVLFLDFAHDNPFFLLVSNALCIYGSSYVFVGGWVQKM
jgi:hypothetical protein